MRKVLLPALAVLAAALIAGCGSDEPAGEEPGDGAEVVATPTAPPEKPGAAAKVPGPLLENASQVNALVPGGQEELDRRLLALQGHPVVVNRWASWCDPCREELPFFNESARTHRAEVAFIGINTQDERGPAEQFLTEVPFPGPSVEDPDAQVAFNLGIGTVSPGTAFIDGTGEVVFSRPGVYATPEELDADIRNYLLSG